MLKVSAAAAILPSVPDMLTLLFDGVAYGMLLFVLAVGLAVTLGLMNFINLAHGAFAMAGGYVTVLLMNRAGLPFLLCLPIAFVATAALGALLERTLYRPMYARPHLDQVLFSIGLTFMAVAAVDYFIGSQQVNVQTPGAEGRSPSRGRSASTGSRVVLCALLTLMRRRCCAHALLAAASAASTTRASRAARTRRRRIFMSSPRLGAGRLAAAGAKCSTRRLPLKFMVYFLSVVAVGGTRR